VETWAKVKAKVKVADEVGCAADFDAIAQSAREKNKISYATSYMTGQLYTYIIFLFFKCFLRI
jgi:hypothetical protein